MAATITAALGTSPNGVPRVRVQLDWDAEASSDVYVYRIRSGAAPELVRSAAPATLDAGGVEVDAIYDYEAPFDVAVQYRALNDDGSASITSSSATLTADSPWLVHAGDPDALSVPLLVGEWPSWTRSINRGVFRPIGSKYPVVVSSARAAEEGTLTIYTTSGQEYEDLLDLLADGSALLLKGIDADGAGARWVAVGDVEESPQETLVTGWNVWTLPLTVVDPPQSEQVAAASYGALTATFASYAAVLADTAADTYQEVIDGGWL